MILERLEKYKEALDVVRGKLGGNLFCLLIIRVVWRAQQVLLCFRLVHCPKKVRKL